MRARRGLMGGSETMMNGEAKMAQSTIGTGSRKRMKSSLSAGLAAIAVVVGIGAAVAPASAVAGPVFEVAGHHGPTTFQPDSIGSYTFAVQNVGDQATSGPVSLDVVLPPGVVTRKEGYLWPMFGQSIGGPLTGGWPWDCGASPNVEGESSVSCSLVSSETSPDGVLHPGQTAITTVFVATPSDLASPATAQVTVAGGGATTVVFEEAVQVGSTASGFGVEPDSWAADAFGPDGMPARQAGGHPFRAMVAMDFNTALNEVALPAFVGAGTKLMSEPAGTARSFDVKLPRGFYGNPRAVAECSAAQFGEESGQESRACPPDSQIGTIDFAARSLVGQQLPPTLIHNAVYNLKPPRGALADFGISVVGREVHITAHLDPSDYSVVTRVRGLNETLPLHFQRLFLWGVPGDPAHDPNRWDGAPRPGGAWGGRSSTPRRPFLTLPSECGVADMTDLVGLTSWQDPDLVGPTLSSVPAEVSGCEKLVFKPSMTLVPDTTAADAPSGLSVDIDLPQDDNPVGLGTPPLRDVEVTLPEGMSINPAAADGLVACSDDQLRLGTNLGLKEGDPSCPEASKVGSVSATSPAIDGPVEGGVYIRSQNSMDPESGEMFRLAIVLENEERGLVVKLPGSVKADPQTGRLTTTFRDNPQLPVDHIKLRLKSGARAPLAMPSSCGVKTIEARVSSWGGQVSNLTDSFTVPCPAGQEFAPGFDAGTTSPTGGRFSPFVALIDRPEGQQPLSRLAMDMPTGLLAKIKGVQLCPDHLAGDGAPGVCPDGSRVGTATVGAGSGSPFHLQGPVYLTGPYKGGPYGISVQVPVKAGPFDLGMVKVRSALHVDPATAQVSVVSDQLPLIVKGVPTRVRTIDVDVDRNDFTINPTSCKTKEIAATFTSSQGTISKAGRRFQTGDCQALPFKPRLAMRMTGKRQTRTGKHPGVNAVVRQTGIGEAGIANAKVTLPKALALDPDNAQALCEYEDGTKPDLENHCPDGSIVGRAKATTPLLDRPLAGNVYFVKNVRRHPKTGNLIRTLPMIVVALRGQIAINLKGESSTAKNGQLINTFAQVPDAPITRFNLNIAGGKNGILAVTRTRKSRINLCTQPKSHRADADMNGHNGKTANYPVKVTTPCRTATKAKAGKTKKTKGKAKRR